MLVRPYNRHPDGAETLTQHAHLSAVPLPAGTATRGDSARALAGAVIETTKPRITKLVTVTAAVGFGMAALARPWTTGELVIIAAGCLAGTALSSGGANALNQWMERVRDGRMPRTAIRPLPQARLTPFQAFVAGAAMCFTGVAVLWLLCGAVAALVSAATIVIYLAVYTPLKPLTPLSTLVGAVPGALPPLIGWAAANPEAGIGVLADPGAWALFLIMFVWQIPHFLAIAWMYRDDYRLGGYRVLPINDEDGSYTAATILAWAVLLLPVTLAPVALLPEATGPGPGYIAVAAGTGLIFLALCIRLARSRTRENARVVFFASIIHLPVLLVVLVVDSLIAALW